MLGWHSAGGGHRGRRTLNPCKWLPVTLTGNSLAVADDAGVGSRVLSSPTSTARLRNGTQGSLSNHLLERATAVR